MADNKVNSGLLEFSEDQKVFVALDAETSEVKKAVTIDGDGVETDIAGGGGGDVTVESLSVTENGTYSEEGKAYSPVTVNVAGAASDLSTANVTVDAGAALEAPIVINEEEFQGIVLISNPEEEDMTYQVPLYKGKCLVNIYRTEEGDTITVSGNITLVSENAYYITGDCSITVTPID